MTENSNKNHMIHNIIMENREKISMSGIKKVDNFDEQSIILLTELGELTIKGENLHISKMDVDTGDLKVTGNIYGLIYNESQKSTSVFKRLLK
ncbi:MAG: sporulation protein YabP [Acutalibacteraceae bacterium]